MRTTAMVLMVAFLSAPAWGVAPTSQPAGRVVAFTVPNPTDVEVAIVDAQGGVVRSLAAGVLGAKDPPPRPLKPGLSQRIEWDGLDDLGRPAGAGPFKARVRSGMALKFGRMVGDSDHNFNETMCRGLAVDTNGDLYVLGVKTGFSGLFFLRVYDRKGNFLREILPYGAGLDVAARQAFGVVSLPGRLAIPQNYLSLWPVFHPFSERGGHIEYPDPKLIGLNPADGSIVLASEDRGVMYRIRKTDGGAIAAAFREPLWKRGEEPNCLEALPMGACSPDGKSLYLTGLAKAPGKGQKVDAKWPDGRVYKMDFGQLPPQRFLDIPFPDSAGLPKWTASYTHTANVCALHGISVDSEGRLFICDAANGKVWVYTAAGKLESSVDVPDAYMAAADPKSGALYVLTRMGNYVRWKKSLVKLSSWRGAAQIVDTMAFPEMGGAPDPFMSVDFSTTPPQIWVSGCPRTESLVRITEDGGKLRIVEDLADRGRLASGYAVRLAVDPEADLIYVNNGYANNLRYNGITGEYAGEVDAQGRPKPIIGSELCVRRDGMIYRGGDSFAGEMSRLTRDLKPASLPDGRATFGYYYGRKGWGYDGNHGCSVDAAGRLVILNMFNWCQYAVFDIGPDGNGIAHPRLQEAAWGDEANYRKAGIHSALIGWLPSGSGGVKIGPRGQVYVGLRLLPRDYKAPEGCEQILGYSQTTGSVIKFALTGGAVHPDDGRTGSWKIGDVTLAIPATFGPGLPMGDLKTQHGITLKKTFVEGAIRAYPGLAPFSGYDNSSLCVCQSPRFDVDDYGRVYIPNALTCSVAVVDDAGNEILTFGVYGNHDSQGPSSKVPKPIVPLAYPVAVGVSFKHVYVADSANRRVVRLDPSYASVEYYELKPASGT